MIGTNRHVGVKALLAGCAILAVFHPATVEGAGAKGLYQAIYAGENVTTGDPATDGVVIPEGALLLAVQSGNPSISATSGGTTYTVGQNTTVAYKGVMRLTAGTTYTFAKNYDDSGYVYLTAPGGAKTEVLSSTTWNEVKYGSYTAAGSGWYGIEVRFGNGGGGVGPTTAPFNAAPYASLLWNDTGLASCTAENRASWHRLVNDVTEGDYLYTEIPVRGISAAYTCDGGNLTASLTLESGDACDLYVCYGAQNGGDTTNGWDHVVKVGTVTADETSATDTSVSGIGTTVSYVRYATYSAAADEFSFSNGYGEPVLSDARISADGNTLRVQATLALAGLGGSGATTVEIYLGTSQDEMTRVYAFNPVSVSGTALQHDITGLVFGAMYYCRLRAWSEDGGVLYETTTDAMKVLISGTMVWNGAGTDWNSASSWDGGAYPVAGLSAQFPSAGGRVEAAADGAADALSVATDTPITFAFGDHALTLGKTEFATEKKSDVTLESGTFDFGVFSYVKKTEDNLLTVKKDAALTLPAAVAIQTCRNKWVIDGGRLTTMGTFSLSTRSGSNGNSTEGSSVTLQNGAAWQAAAIKCGCWHNAKIAVLSGSTLTAGSVTISNDQDSGSGNGMIVSNATATVSGLAVCSDDRHGSSYLRLYQDEGQTASLTVTGSMSVSSEGNGCRHGRNNRVDLAGGTLTVGDSLRVSSNPNDPLTGQSNVVSISRASSRFAVTKKVSFQRDTKVAFTVPAEGYAAEAVFTAGTTMTFSEQASVAVDATAARKSMNIKLLKAGTALSGLTAERVAVTVRPGWASKVKLDETSLVVHVGAPGLSIVVR